MHKLSKTIAMMGLLAPLGASALGVGDIRLHSGLNQSLNAEIPLVLSGADSLDDVKVSLAGPEAFAKAGVERQYFLTKLQFSTVQKSNGQYAILVSSREVMREPFLNFLVEVNWPQGRVLREFTVLLDPPASLPEEAMAETAPPAVERPYGAYPRERVAEISRADEIPPARRPSRKIVTAVPQPASVSAASPSPPSEDQLSGDAYGPVQRGETLWSIANSLARNSSATPEQIVRGLFRANPQAFAGSINALKAGTILRIPTPEYLAQLGPQRGSARPAGRGPESLAAREGQTPQNQLRLLSPPEAKPRDGGATTGGKAKSDLALEVAETVKQENEEFRARLIQLEQKLGDMERLLTLKDEQIAVLQTQRGAPQPSATAPAKPVAPPAPSAPQPPAAPAQAPAVPAPSAGTAPQPPTPPATVQPPVTAQPPQLQPGAVKPPEIPAPPPAATTPKPAVPRPPTPAPQVEEPGFAIDSHYLIAGGGLALLGLGAWLIKRRRNAMIAETESILLAAERESSHPPQISPSRVTDSGLEPIVATKSSFLSEFTPSDFDALGTETDDVDPISEADVYLAYGRYKQAEELIRHAIAQRPEHDESKLKLLEIYYATENRTAFENYAKELKAAKKDAQPEFWSKVVEMGRELVPHSSLFQAPGQRQPKSAGQESAAGKGFGALDLSDDLIDDLRRFEIEFVEPASMEEEDFIPLSFDEGEKQALGEPEEPAGDDKSLEFDIASLYRGEAAASVTEKESRASEATELENLISPDFGKAQPKPPEKPASSPADALFDDLLRDLGSRAGASQEKPETAPPADSGGQDRPLGKLGFDLGLFEPDAGLTEDFGLAEEAQTGAETESAGENVFAELTDMDQCETKLDLAKAYADMEDEDSAREILQEVFAGGNERQRAEASALLSKLSQAQAEPEFSIPEPRTGRM